MDNCTARALALANRRPGPGGGRWELGHIEGCAITSDACSGGLSRFYRKLLEQPISCRWCCVCHDFLYGVGGTDKDRRAADRLLRDCAARAGKFTGWRGPLRRVWRLARAWVMYAAVRLFGGRYWSR